MVTPFSGWPGLGRSCKLSNDELRWYKRSEARILHNFSRRAQNRCLITANHSCTSLHFIPPFLHRFSDAHDVTWGPPCPPRAGPSTRQNSSETACQARERTDKRCVYTLYIHNTSKLRVAKEGHSSLYRREKHGQWIKRHTRTQRAKEGEGRARSIKTKRKRCESTRATSRTHGERGPHLTLQPRRCASSLSCSPSWAPWLSSIAALEQFSVTSTALCAIFLPGLKSMAVASSAKTRQQTWQWWRVRVVSSATAGCCLLQLWEMVSYRSVASTSSDSSVRRASSLLS
jgi:hypothetical protein